MCSILICCVGIFFLTMKHKMLKAQRRQKKQDKATAKSDKSSKEMVGEILAGQVQAVSTESLAQNPPISGEFNESPYRSPIKSNFESPDRV